MFAKGAFGAEGGFSFIMITITQYPLCWKEQPYDRSIFPFSQSGREIPGKEIIRKREPSDVD